MSDKSSRQPPTQDFSQYTVTRYSNSESGLLKVPQRNFQQITGSAGASYAIDQLSGIYSIGFPFKFFDKTYLKFHVSTAGWLVLVDPQFGTMNDNYTNVLDYNIDDPEGITFGSVSSFYVMLAVWFDSLRNLAEKANDVSPTFGATKIARINAGLEPGNQRVNGTRYGISYCVEDSSFGRRLIVRWRSGASSSLMRSNLEFECVLYENGTIEYRYPPKSSLTLASTANESACIGIFPQFQYTFRDLSDGLGYKDNQRQIYNKGGYTYTSSYGDGGTGVPWTVSLQSYINWPGGENWGTTYVISPQKQRRKILPRLDIKKPEVNVRRLGKKKDITGKIYVDSMFDDRTSEIFSGAITVDPTIGFNRLKANATHIDISQNQNLFLHNDSLFITQSTSKFAQEQLIFNEKSGRISPFSEVNLYENSPNFSSGSFFVSGTQITEVGDGLSQSLRSKSKIKINLSVENNVVVLPETASMYYYNRNMHTWNIPVNSSYTITNTSTTNNSGISKGDLANPTVDSSNIRLLEDARGWGPVGNTVTSGTVSPGSTEAQTDEVINSTFSLNNVSIALTQELNNSITKNANYEAAKQELIPIDIDYPFVVEKATIDIPLCFGSRWFLDKTSTFIPLETRTGNNFDFGGPALTVGLMCQHKFATGSLRDVILTGTITHANDNVSNIVFSNFPDITLSPESGTYQIRREGFLAFSSNPSAVIPYTGGAFSGTVSMNLEAQVSNGVSTVLKMRMNSSNTAINRSGVLDLFNLREIDLASSYASLITQSVRIGYVNNFGRAGTGFEPSCRSIFGKEFTTYQNSSSKSRNPFFLTESNGTMTFGNLFNTMPSYYRHFANNICSGSRFIAHTVVPLQTTKPSPYLLLPGDKLVLALSKTKPFMFSSLSNWTSGTVTHDVTLMTGTISITLYGSYLRENKEISIETDKTYQTDDVFTVIGDEPVLDEFDFNYSLAYASSTFDDYVAGDMISRYRTPDGSVKFVTGSILGFVNGSPNSYGTRGRVFGKNSARYSSQPGTTLFDFTRSRSYRAQPNIERAGYSNISQHDCTSERYWDSCVPSFDQCMSRDSTGIFVFASQSQAGVIGDLTTTDQDCGYLLFDFILSGWNDSIHPVVNSNWTKAYPFEPRYSTVIRQETPSKIFTANYSMTVAGTSPNFTYALSSIARKQVTGLFFGPVGTRNPSVPAIDPVVNNPSSYNPRNLIVSDAFLVSDGATTNLTTSVGSNDFLKCVYGFGDLNTMMSTSLGTGNTVIGTNHFADFRNKFLDTNNFGTNFSVSPVIRGWKYGLVSATPTFTKCVFRRNKFGQFRDMLEQRVYTRFNNPSESDISTSPVTIRFVKPDGTTTDPENTWSQNVSTEATSSVPYFDGETRNRQEVNPQIVNSSIVTVKLATNNLVEI